MTKLGDLILNENEIEQKLKRIAFQIFENNTAEKEMVIAGINGQGYILAEQLIKVLEKICSTKLRLVKVEINKRSPASATTTLNCNLEEVKNKVVILVDDVLNTGQTMAYSLLPLLNARVKKLEVAVLVNRDHNQFPVRATYTGYELSTTLQNHIEVQLGQKKMGVYLQ